MEYFLFYLAVRNCAVCRFPGSVSEISRGDKGPATKLILRPGKTILIFEKMSAEIIQFVALGVGDSHG